MILKNKTKYRVVQTGAALLIFLTILILGMTTFLLARLNQTPLKLEDQAQTAHALAEAKAALLGFAATYSENHPGQPQGYLPCPDFNGDGSSPYSSSSDTSCGDGGKSVIGRLPWRTLGLPALRDGNGECLWYAVSGSYKDRPKSLTYMLTNDMNGLFSIQDIRNNTIIGNSPSNRAIAIIFSAGKLIANQNRSFTTGQATECGSAVLTDPVNNPSNYLDTINNISNALGGTATTGGTLSLHTNAWTTNTALQTSQFIQSQEIREQNNEAKVLFNDHLVAITPDDFVPVYRRMDSWVANRVKECLIAYTQQYAENYFTTHGIPAPTNKYPWVTAITDETYTDTDGQRFGRIAQAPLLQTNTIDSNFPINWTREPQVPIPEIDLLEIDLSALDVTEPSDLQLLLNQLGFIDEQSLLDALGLTDASLLATTLNNTQSTQELKRCFNEAGGIINWQWGWWTAWKDKVFVAINGNNSPLDATSDILLNNISKELIILVAGRQLNGQNRTTLAEKSALDNYLEGSNNDGDHYFITDYNANFNDTVIAIP